GPAHGPGKSGEALQIRAPRSGRMPGCRRDRATVLVPAASQMRPPGPFRMAPAATDRSSRGSAFVQRLAHERRQHRRGPVDVGAVVEGLELLAARILLAEVEAGAGLLARQRATPPAGRVAR